MPQHHHHHDHYDDDERTGKRALLCYCSVYADNVVLVRNSPTTSHLYIHVYICHLPRGACLRPQNGGTRIGVSKPITVCTTCSLTASTRWRAQKRTRAAMCMRLAAHRLQQVRFINARCSLPHPQTPLTTLSPTSFGGRLRNVRKRLVGLTGSSITPATSLAKTETG